MSSESVTPTGRFRHPRLLPRSFYRRPAREVAPELLNKVLMVRAGRRGAASGASSSGRIVEVEAYEPRGDQASHSFRGRTARNASMFGRPGLLYVYFTYGMHWCANAVCEREEVGAAVLIRALEPLTGLDLMRQRRLAAKSDRDLCSGPAKLAQALGLDGSSDGLDLTEASGRVGIYDDGVVPPSAPGRSRRIGIRRSVELEWRWFVAGSDFLSR